MKATQPKNNSNWPVIWLIIAVAVCATIGLIIKNTIIGQKTGSSIIYSEQTQETWLLDDKGEVEPTTEYNGEQIPTVEEVDGGFFEDNVTGVSTMTGDYEDLGATIETFDTSTPEAFRDATLGKCIYANNKWGAQCVSLSRSFWWSYANRDVSTCGTGMAKGMMKCADQNAGSDFDIYWKNDVNKIQSGDWLVFDGGQYGHVGMALGPVKNGYVALLGENQGGRACDGGGAATNIINISTRQLIGFYRPKAYIKPEPKPEPTPTPTPTPQPTPTPTTVTYTVKKGDTLGAILRSFGYKGNKLFGNAGLTQKIAENNGIKNRGLIYPKQTIVIDKSLFNAY